MIAGNENRDLAVGLVLDRPGEHLAVGEVAQALRRDPGAAVDPESEIGVLRHQPNGRHLLELGRQELELPAELAPGGHRVVELKPPRAVDEILVGAQ